MCSFGVDTTRRDGPRLGFFSHKQAIPILQGSRLQPAQPVLDCLVKPGTARSTVLCSPRLVIGSVFFGLVMVEQGSSGEQLSIPLVVAILHLAHLRTKQLPTHQGLAHFLRAHRGLCTMATSSHLLIHHLGPGNLRIFLDKRGSWSPRAPPFPYLSKCWDRWIFSRWA